MLKLQTHFSAAVAVSGEKGNPHGIVLLGADTYDYSCSQHLKKTQTTVVYFTVGDLFLTLLVRSLYLPYFLKLNKMLPSTAK